MTESWYCVACGVDELVLRVQNGPDQTAGRPPDPCATAACGARCCDNMLSCRTCRLVLCELWDVHLCSWDCRLPPDR